MVILLLFALLFWWVMHHRQAPAAARRRQAGAAGGTVTLTTATAKQGSIGVYLDAIGTVTPVYTTTIISQVTGVIGQVRYREGQMVRRGQPLIQIDPRPFQANVLTAQGQLERDTNLLAQAQMDLKRYQDAWARNAIPKQTLDDQEKIVLQYQGTVKADQGTLQYDQVQLGFTNIISPSPAAWVSAWSIPETWYRLQRYAPGRGHPNTAHHRGLHHSGRQCRPAATADAAWQGTPRGRPGSLRPDKLAREARSHR